MAGANNKSGKKLGYSAKQLETVRSQGGVLSHAALMAHGEPARPTKAYKALVSAMAARKQGLTRKTEPPKGWQAAARGEGKGERSAATAARAAFVSQREGQVKRSALAAKGARDLGGAMLAKRKAAASAASARPGLDLRRNTERRVELTERLRAKADGLREAQRTTVNKGDDARAAAIGKQLARTNARAERADNAATDAGMRYAMAPSEKRAAWDRTAAATAQKKAAVARGARSIGAASKIALTSRKKAVATAKTSKQDRAKRIADRYEKLRKEHTYRLMSRAGEIAQVREAFKAAKKARNKAAETQAQAKYDGLTRAQEKTRASLDRVGVKAARAQARASR